MKKFTSIAICLLSIGSISAQSQSDNSAEVIPCSEFSITKPLRELAEEYKMEEADATEVKESKDRLYREPQTFQFSVKDGPEYGNDPASLQTQMGTRSMLPPLTNWAGQSTGSYPPDPSGAAGPNHYVQAVNATPLRIYNKGTGAVMMSTSVGALFGSSTNDGDPIILYDKYADRWFISQFGFSGNKIFIAISQTNDPTGAYYTYTFTSSQFPDYLKFSIWADGYYMTSNQFTDKVFCFERDQMLLGNPSARSIVKNFTTGSVSGFFCPLPADADGVLPPLGTPLPFFSYYENAWGGGVDAVKIWDMSVTWGAVPTATISTSPVIIPTAAFDGTYDPGWNDIPQPGTSAKLDGIGGVPTYRAQWRKWTGYNTVCLNWGVKISSTQRSIKWVELRQDQVTGLWSLFQEGTYTPDTKSRWVGSMAMDDNGGIGLCYARSSGTAGAGNYPSLCYTGRLSTDAYGLMTFAETVVIAGTSSQTVTNRFGDYSHTSLDPSDGLTFWHTGEYLSGGSPKTRIFSFKLPLASDVSTDAASQVEMSAFINGNELSIKANNLISNDELIVDLFDIAGRQLKSKKEYPFGNSMETSFDVSDLASGTYLVRIGRLNTSFQKVIRVTIAK